MTYEQVMKYFVTQEAVAKAAGVQQPAISGWRRRGRVPPLHQLRLEKATRGALKAEKGIV